MGVEKLSGSPYMYFLRHAAADEEYEKLRERRRNCQTSRMSGQVKINLSSLTIVPMPAILIVLHMIISGSPTQSAAYRSHHSPTGKLFVGECAK